VPYYFTGFTYNECVLLLTKLVLVNKTCVSEDIWCHVVYTVLRCATAHQLETLHVPPLRSSQREDSVLDKDIQTERVDTLLVYYHEALLRVVAANLLLQLHDLPQLLVNEAALALNKLLPLFGARVVETRVNLRLFVL